MFDIGWTELLVIGIVALIVVGPKDLPILFRRMGEFTGKARAMAREFSRAMDDAADQAGVKDIQTSLKAAANPKQFGLDAINKAASDLENMDDDADDKPRLGTPLSPDRAEAARKIHEATAAAEQRKQEAADDAAAARETAAQPDPAPETTDSKPA